MGYPFGEKETGSHPSFRVFPNPASGHVFLDLKIPSQHPVNIDVLNVMGEKVYHRTIDKYNEQGVQLNIAPYKSGVYIIKVQSGNYTMTQKIIKP